MAELKLRDGDYVRSGGGLRKVEGQDALLQRVLFKLTARRGKFPFQEELGSQLWKLGRLPVSQRCSAAEQYVTEALADETLAVESVELTPGESGMTQLTVRLLYEGQTLSVTMSVQ